MTVGTKVDTTTDSTAEKHATDIMITMIETDIMTGITIDMINLIETGMRGVRNMIDIMTDTTETATIATTEDQGTIIEDMTIVDIVRGMKLQEEQAVGIAAAEVTISHREDQKAAEVTVRVMPVRGIMVEEVMIITETEDGEINRKYKDFS